MGKTISEEIDDIFNTKEAPKRYCPKCGRSIPFDAKVCPYCMHKFEEF